MKNTGMIRRIDNLGRIVIPKEIRASHNIKEGSALEIGVGPNGEIMLTSHDIHDRLRALAYDYLTILHGISDIKVAVVDDSGIVSTCNISAKSVQNNLSKTILDYISNYNIII